jgi:MATE family multidrug resistance protein
MKNSSVTYKELWGVSFPLLLSAINQTLMTFLAIPSLGHYSLDAMVVAASAAPLNMILSVTLMASLMGYRILGSKAVGSGDSTEIGSLFGNALLFSEGLAFLFVVLLALFGEMAVRICLSDTNLTHQTVQYLRILSAAYPLSILLQICLCTLGFYKKTRTILYVNLLMDALNIGLSYIFVYGCFGVFEGGVLGAAFAVPLTQFLLCIGTVWYLLKRQPWLYSACAINFQKMRQLIILSWPAMLSMLGDYFGTFITFTMIGQFLGPEMLVGGRVTWTLLMVCFVSITSMGSGFMILGGRALGQGNTSAFHRYFVCNRRMLLGIASFLGGLIFVFHTPILFFITSFETIRQELAVPLMLMGITVPLIGWSWSSASCLRLLEKVRVDMICNLLSLWLVQIPCFYLLGIVWEMNLTGLILSFFIYDLVYGLSTSVCVNKFLKKPHAQEVLQGNEAVV